MKTPKTLPPVTAADMHALRLEKSRVNHETYKEIYARVNERIKTHGTMGERELVVKIPVYIPGRPVYDVTHAARYVIEKLKLAGFDAREYTPPDVVYVSWKHPPPPKKTKKQPPPPAVTPAMTPADTARRLDLLRLKLKSLTK